MNDAITYLTRTINGAIERIIPTTELDNRGRRTTLEIVALQRQVFELMTRSNAKINLHLLYSALQDWNRRIDSMCEPKSNAWVVIGRRKRGQNGNDIPPIKTNNYETITDTTLSGNDSATLRKSTCINN